MAVQLVNLVSFAGPVDTVSTPEIRDINVSFLQVSLNMIPMTTQQLEISMLKLQLDAVQVYRSM